MKFPILRRRSAPQTPRSGLREPPPSPELLDRDGRKRRYPMTCEHGVYLLLCPLCSPPLTPETRATDRAALGKPPLAQGG